MTNSSSSNDPAVLAAVAAGGALGGLCRFGVAQLIPAVPGGFPWATFWTNISGSLLLGILIVVATRCFPSNRFVRPFFATGLLGAYTTFSTLTVEVDLLLGDGAAATALVYCAATLVCGLAAAWAGIRLGRSLAR